MKNEERKTKNGTSSFFVLPSSLFLLPYEVKYVYRLSDRS
jgi:hypothetical protein